MPEKNALILPQLSNVVELLKLAKLTAVKSLPVQPMTNPSSSAVRLRHAARGQQSVASP
jgi:hypothetical protein